MMIGQKFQKTKAVGPSKLFIFLCSSKPMTTKGTKGAVDG